jgi:hypothetical protein
MRRYLDHALHNAGAETEWPTTQLKSGVHLKRYLTEKSWFASGSWPASQLVTSLAT